MSKFPFWTEESRHGLAADMGERGVGLVREMCQFAYDQTDLWLHRPFAEAIREVELRLRSKYPELDQEATQRIVAYAAYDWK